MAADASPAFAVATIKPSRADATSGWDFETEGHHIQCRNATVRWTYDVAREGDAEAPPSVFTAIREQLGLKMEAVKGPTEVYVVDRVERPSEN